MKFIDKDREFDDIRPFRDEEVKGVLERLAASSGFEQGMQFMMGKYISLADESDRIDINTDLREIFSSLNTIDDFQREIVLKRMLEPMIKHTVDEITSSGLENLSKNEAYLFISNHRDITLDPALLNYILLKNGFDTVEIAFGDNLLMNDFVSDLIRVNKSFIVKRNLPIMEQLGASKQLSGYINYVIHRNQSVWIAQREGRAKDGNDLTNSAVISMISLSRREGDKPFGEFIRNLKIVPIAISYEYDPCDRLKALELYNIKTKGKHSKSATEDLVSMNRGIAGYKGRIHYSFGDPLLGDYANDKEVAKELDRSIQGGYRLWPTNYIAYDLLSGSPEYSGMYTEDEKKKFLENSDKFADDVKKIIYEIYANPVKNFMLHNK